MTLALAGIICLQIYWIGWNIRLNEEQFDKNVYAALNRVAGKLQYYEEVSVLEALNSSSAKGTETNRNIRRATQHLENGFSKRRLAQQPDR